MKLVSIGEASRRTGLSIETLRFYEREGLTPGPVARDAAGRRAYSEEDLEWLLMTARLRLTQMPISRIRRYADLVRQGASSIPERLEMLADHERAVRAQIAELQSALAAIDRKVADYRMAATA